MRLIALAIAFFLLAIPANAASRFWVGGTGTWDSSTTTHWASSSGGAGGQSVPGASDTVTFDGSSGGGTVTVNFGGTISITSLAMGAFTGTLDFSANNNSITLSGGNNAFNNAGTAVRTLNMGNGSWTFTGTSGQLFVQNTVTNLTFNPNSSTVVFTATTTATRSTDISTSTPLNATTINANTSLGAFGSISNTNYGTLTINGPNYFTIPANSTMTISGLTISATNTTPVILTAPGNNVTAPTISSSANISVSWAGIYNINFTGGGTFKASSSMDLGANTGIIFNYNSACLPGG